MKIFSRLRLPIIFLVAAVLAAILAFSIPSLFESVKNISVRDIQAQAPITLTKKIFLSGKCQVQLYGWAFDNPGPTDGADEYLEILKLDASLNSKRHSLALVAKPKVNDTIPEHIWEIDVPRTGVLEINIQRYMAPSKDLKIADVFLRCESSGFSRVSGALLIIAILLGLVEMFLLLSYGIRTGFRK